MRGKLKESDVKMKKKLDIASIGSDKNKSSKYLVIGIVIAVAFGTIIGISKSLANNADEWKVYKDLDNDENYDQGVYGYQDFLIKQREIALTHAWLEQQQIIFVSIAQIGVNIGLICVFIGFIGFAVNDSLDERTRRVSLLLAAVVLFVLMFTTLFSQITLYFS